MSEPFAGAKREEKVWCPECGWGEISSVFPKHFMVSFYIVPQKVIAHAYLFSGKRVDHYITNPNRSLYHQKMQVVAPLVYQDKLPDKEGWWWFDDGLKYVLRIRKEKGEYGYYDRDGFFIPCDKIEGCWAGPLDEPQKPGGVRDEEI